ncbi:hypothetical protein IKE80_00665 [Candidatus Saccharibacteria bacterium]|nr:hypothetical protein [Candidatus Saccharibacteria bacterium]
MDAKRGILAVVVVFSLVLFGIFFMPNSEERNLIGVVEATYEQAMKGENIPCEQTWEIERLYNDGVKGLSEIERDELDRKINVIADSCEFDPGDIDSPTPFRPIAKELRQDRPAGPWAGPTD